MRKKLKNFILWIGCWNRHCQETFFICNIYKHFIMKMCTAHTIWVRRSLWLLHNKSARPQRLIHCLHLQKLIGRQFINNHDLYSTFEEIPTYIVSSLGKWKNFVTWTRVIFICTSFVGTNVSAPFRFFARWIHNVNTLAFNK
jgi:hypothetical protein